MSIQKQDGLFIAECDICGDTLPGNENWKAAQVIARTEGWTFGREDGEWKSYCDRHPKGTVKSTGFNQGKSTGFKQIKSTGR